MYRGWKIDHNPGRPVTGVWMARRYGVTLSAGTRPALERMVDVHMAGDLRSTARRNDADEAMATANAALAVASVAVSLALASHDEPSTPAPAPDVSSGGGGGGDYGGGGASSEF